MGGVGDCDTRDPFTLSLYKMYNIILTELKTRDPNVGGKKGRLVGRNLCNLWLWKKTHNTDYHNQRDDPVNHIDIFWEPSRNAFTVQVKKHIGGENVHTNKYHLPEIKYINDNHYAIVILNNILEILNNEFP